MKTFFKDLLEYGHHFNQKLGDAFIIDQGITAEQSLKLYCHILNAHQIWNGRIEPNQSPFEIWEIHPIQNCKDIDKKITKTHC